MPGFVDDPRSASEPGVDRNAAATAACLCHERLAGILRHDGFNQWLMRHSPLALAGNYPQHPAQRRKAGDLPVQNLPTGELHLQLPIDAGAEFSL
jgi:hypothetical protein